MAEIMGSHPAIGNPIDAVFRRVVLVRFPFSVICGAERETSLIVAVAHQRRKPGYWHGRVGR